MPQIGRPQNNHPINVREWVNSDEHKNFLRLNSLANSENKKMSGKEIGINESGIDQKLIIGNVLGAFSSKSEAEYKAKSIKGSEIVYQKDNVWYVSTVKEKNVFSEGNSNLSKDDKDDIVIDKNSLKKDGVSNPSISFVEDDYKTYDYVKPQNKENESDPSWYITPGPKYDFSHSPLENSVKNSILYGK